MLSEAVRAQQLIKQELPDVRVRFVYVSSLTCGAIGHHDHQLDQAEFEQIFTADRPIIFNFHGYPETIKAILFNYLTTNRASVHGYREQGSTTTPFDMMVRNQTSRWHLLMATAEALVKTKKISADQRDQLLTKYHQKIAEHIDYIKQHGVDLPEIA